MPTSSSVYDDMMGVKSDMDKLLNVQGQAPGYFKRATQKAFGYNLPAIKNAAALEAGAYDLPGRLMDQYNTEYGGNTGVGSMARMNSILKNIGSQFGLANTAWNLVDDNQMRMDEVAKGIADQYRGTLDAYKTKWDMLNPIWQTLFGAEEAAKARWRPQPQPLPEFSNVSADLVEPDNGLNRGSSASWGGNSSALNNSLNFINTLRNGGKKTVVDTSGLYGGQYIADPSKQ